MFIPLNGEPLTYYMRTYINDEKRKKLLLEFLENPTTHFLFDDEFPAELPITENGKLNLEDVVVHNRMKKVTENRRDKHNTFCALPFNEEITLIITTPMEDEATYQKNYEFWQFCFAVYCLMKNSKLPYNYSNNKNATTPN